MLQRILTAVVLIPVVAALVLRAPLWLFFIGLLPFALLALWEYLELAARMNATPARLPVYLAALALWAVAAWRAEHLLAMLIGASSALFLLAMARPQMTADVFWAAATAVFGLFYVALPFALMLVVRGLPYGAQGLLFLLVLIWVTDTAAYFGGKALGRHKLAPAISPGKTIEGTATSVVATSAAAYFLFRYWFPLLPEVHGLLLGLIVNIVGQFGDLAESALKRGAGVKDSSGLLPGHGGMLDRIDSLLFAAPALWYYWWLLTRSVIQP
ncbi:MAG TPA: phosphatidate cytidylyltransferase [Candidatus Xenobia bacterium]|nr:phosphatidate cytidylyltransferase [Candidatus Xenobia bacterium]